MATMLLQSSGWDTLGRQSLGLPVNSVVPLVVQRSKARYQQMTISQFLSSFIVLQIVCFRRTCPRSLLQNMFRNGSYDALNSRESCIMTSLRLLFDVTCVLVQPAYQAAIKAKNWHLTTITLCFIEKSKQVMVGLWTIIKVSVLVCMPSAGWTDGESLAYTYTLRAWSYRRTTVNLVDVRTPDLSTSDSSLLE